MTKITKQQAEEILTKKYGMKYIQFTYPGYPPVVGRCDRICIGDGIKDRGLVLIFIDGKKYNCSPECLKDCLTLLKKDNGDTRTGGNESPKGSR